MIDAIQHAFQALQADATAYSAGVRLWMRLMAISFLSAVLFVRWWRDAWWIFLVPVLTMALLVLGKILAPELSRSLSGSIIHLVVWPLLLYAVWSPPARARRRASAVTGWARQVFNGWLLWVSALMTISLVLDCRFIILTLAG